LRCERALRFLRFTAQACHQRLKRLALRGGQTRGLFLCIDLIAQSCKGQLQCLLLGQKPGLRVFQRRHLPQCRVALRE